MRVLLTEKGKIIEGDSHILSLVEGSDLSDVKVPRVNIEELAKLYDKFEKIKGEKHPERMKIAKQYVKVRELYLSM